MDIIAVEAVHGEARADSRHLAERMGNHHKNVLSLLDDYLPDFQALGAIAFETRPNPGGGKPVRIAFLNEEQCYFLLTLVRNSETTVPMKRELVQAFTEFRQRALSVPAALPAAVGMEFLQQFAGNVVLAIQQQAATTKEEVKAELRQEFTQQIGEMTITSVQNHQVKTRISGIVGRRRALGLPGANFQAAYRETWDACQVGSLASMTRDQHPRVIAYLDAQLAALTSMDSSGLFGGPQ